MKRQMTMKQRVIYSYEFKNNNTVYIGLTCDIVRRHNAHMGKEKKYGEVSSPVYKFMNESGEFPKFKILTKKPIKEENAPKSEDYYINKYRKNGWIIMNKAKAGSLGGNQRKWSKDTLKKICDSCTKISELKEMVPTWAFYVIRENGWFEELTSHMEYDVRKGWTDEEVLKISHQYDNISSLSKEYNGVAKYIRNRPELRKQLDEFWNKRQEEIELEKQPTKDECIKIALKYILRTDFRNKDRRIFEFAEKEGWIDEICGHMTRIYWTYERCKEEVLKYQYKCELYKYSKGCYNMIYQNKWYELLSHMSNRKLRNNGVYSGKYTLEMIKELAKQCKNKSEFQDRFSGAYKASKKMNCLNELF
jgi:predicted GIY-YIG superfamily endonuclease